MSLTNLENKRVEVAVTACERFERLGDRIKLIVLGSINGSIAEKDALLNTVYFPSYFRTITQHIN